MLSIFVCALAYAVFSFEKDPAWHRDAALALPPQSVFVDPLSFAVMGPNATFRQNSFDPAGFARNALAELHNLFDNPNANREDASNAYLVMQANIHVTQQVVRLVIEQYRHTLVTSMLASGVDPASLHSSIAANELSRGGWTFEDREAIARDLLDILRKIPILSIATNGPVLVHKVRFVASTLLDFVRDAETAPDPAAKALNILWDFLSMLSEIERKYLPLDNSSEQDQ